MAATLVQDKDLAGGGADITVSLDSAPTPGNTLVAFLEIRDSGDSGGAATGWTAVPDEGGVRAAQDNGGFLYAFYRVVDGTDDGTYTFTTGNILKHVFVTEWSGVGGLEDYSFIELQADGTAISVGPVTLAGTAGLAIGAFISAGNGPMGGNTQPDIDIDAPYTHAWYSGVEGVTDPDDASGNGPTYAVGYQVLSAAGDSTLEATKDLSFNQPNDWAGILLLFGEAAAVPTVAEPGIWMDWARDGFDDGSTGGGSDDPRLARGLPQAASVGTAYGGDNVTSRVKSASWFRGASYDHVGQPGPGGFTILLDNHDGLFDPDNTASPLYGFLTPGVPVWGGAIAATGALSTANGTGIVRGFLAGRVREFTPTVSSDGTRVCEVIGDDALAQYQRATVSVEPSLARSHATLRRLILDAVGESATRRSLAAETGMMPFSAVDSANALSILDELNRATGTRHFVAPADSKEDWYDYTTVNKLHKLTAAEDQTLDGDDISDVSGWRVTNENVVEVQRATVEPISLTPDNGIVWEYADAPFSVPLIRPRILYANFDDYVFDTTVDVNFATGSGTATVTNFGKTARVTIWATSTNTTVGYVHVLGQQVVRGDSETVVAGDESPGALAGNTISSDFIGQTGAAQGLVDFIVWKFGSPLKRPQLSVIAKNAATLSTIFERDLFDVLTLSIDKLSVSGRRAELIGLRGSVTPRTSASPLYSLVYEMQETPNPSAITGWFVVNTDSVNGPQVLAPF